MAGSELNAFGVAGVPLQNTKFAIVSHGPAIAAILDEAHSREKFGVNNPNPKVLSQLTKCGAEMFVCGHNLAADKIDLKTIVVLRVNRERFDDRLYHISEERLV